MKNLIPKYRTIESRAKNKVNISDLFFLNVQSKIISTQLNAALSEKLIDQVKESLQSETELIRNAFGNEQRKERLKAKIFEIVSKANFIDKYKSELGNRRPGEIATIILEKLVGLDVLEGLRNDPNVTDIKVIDYDHIRVDDIHKGKYRTKLSFDSMKSYEELLNRFAFASSKPYSQGSPSYDAMFPQMRINVVGYDLTKTPSLQLRSVSKTLRINKESMIETGYLNEDMYNLLKKTFATHSHLFSGETGTGKTELFRYLARYTKPQTDIVMIEDTPESYLDELYDNEKYSITMWKNRDAKSDSKSDFGYRYHLRNAMRQNFDYIFMQESRGAEALDILKALSTGHIVSSTIHGKSAFGAINRGIDLCQEAQMLSSEIYGKRLVGEDGFRIGIHVERFGEKRVRKINQIVEYVDYVDGRTIGNVLFEYDELNDVHVQKDNMSERLWKELLSYHKDLSDLINLSPNQEITQKKAVISV